MLALYRLVRLGDLTDFKVRFMFLSGEPLPRVKTATDNAQARYDRNKSHYQSTKLKLVCAVERKTWR